ncbi:Transcription factor Ouib [Nibea albiflora]|uniref:Transcription factor Ouib n=1 Tax=Nibea albiflora TaxID=240163 RepID=A0ACB7EV86_NIBAL|nr:Transcription factor Ouib [Nibea albiflora]
MRYSCLVTHPLHTQQGASTNCDFSPQDPANVLRAAPYPATLRSTRGFHEGRLKLRPHSALCTSMRALQVEAMACVLALVLSVLLTETLSATLLSPGGELGGAPCEELRFYICSTSSSEVFPKNNDLVQSQMVPNVSLFDVMWGKSDSLVVEILHSSSFLKELWSGQLTQGCYARFMQQEALYLHRVSSMLEVLLGSLQEADDMRPLLMDTLKHYSSRTQSLLDSPLPLWLQLSLRSFHLVVLEEPVYWVVALLARASLLNFLAEELQVSEVRGSSYNQEWSDESLKESAWTQRYRNAIAEHQDRMDVFKAINIFRVHMMNQKSFYKAVPPRRPRCFPGGKQRPSRSGARRCRRSAGGQQDEPGLALSPDGPGASPEPPSLSHTPDGNAATDTLASDMLRKLAERQEVNSLGVRVKEEEEPMEVDTLVAPDLVRDRSLTKEMTTPSSTPSHHLFSIKTEDQGFSGNKMAEQSQPRAEMADQCLHGLKIEDKFFTAGCQPGSKTPDSVVSGANKFQFRVKVEDDGVSGNKMTGQLLSGAKMEDQLLFKAKIAERPFSGAKISNKFLSWSQDGGPVSFRSQDGEPASLWNQNGERASSRSQDGGPRFLRSKSRGAALLWSQDGRPIHLWSQDGRPVPQSRAVAGHVSEPGVHAAASALRCHVCGFETDSRALFQSHMTEHRQWEHGSFSLHCCVCDHSTNQEAEMRAHANTHMQGIMGVSAEMRCPITPPAASASAVSSGIAPSVAVATQPENGTSEHRCRICQRSFPGQQELLVHFQGHRQGNQYRCDRCGHLTRTANKLVEHVRVHTGERPFTCDLCPYSAKRRDSLRLHCKVKHAADVHTHRSYVHTHRSYVHGDNQRSNKHVQRLHTPPSAHTAAHASSSSSSSSLPPLHPSLSDRAGWRDLSPLLPITTLISLKPRPPSSPSSSSSSSSIKHSFLGYLGLKTSL